jgi:hypothetical protein
MPSLLRIASSLVAVTSLVAFAGCSGAKPQLVEEAPSASDDAGSSPTGGDDTSGSSSGGSSSGSSSSSGGGTPVGTPAPSSCPAGGVTEDGTNDKRSSAIAFTTAACGTVVASGEDWWKFTLPSTAKKLAFEFSGKVDLEITSEGDTVVIQNGVASGPIPFHADGEYEIEVYTETGASQAYVLLAEDQ